MNKKYFSIIFACVWLVVACVTFAQKTPEVFAQEPAAVAVPTPVEAEVAEVPATIVPGEEKEECDNCVSLDFRDADIRTVLQILSYKSGVNIVATPEVTGLVTIQLSNVPWDDALEVILGTYGYGYEQKGNIIKVSTLEDIKKSREDAMAMAEQEAVETKTFVLNYASAPEVLTSIEKMITSRGSLNYDQRTNTIIVRDTVSNVKLIGEVLKRLDKATPQVLIEAKIIETTLSNTENMGIDWTIQATIAGGKMPIYYPFTAMTANKYARDIVWPTPEDDDFTYGTLDFSQFQAVLEILDQRSDTDILSNPSIMTLDNQPASIVVGTQYPLPQYTYNEDQAKLQVSGWEYKDIGIIFKVTPQVNDIGYVTLLVEPQITAIIDYVLVENTSVPQISNESASTRVMVKDGQTLVIAGLIKNQWTDVEKKVPLLGDIPFIGKWFFAKTNKTLTKTELIVFITPRIITPDQPDDTERMEKEMKRFEARELRK